MRKNKLSLPKIRWVFHLLSLVVLLSCLVSYFQAGASPKGSLTILTGLTVLFFLLLNIVFRRVTSNLYQRLLQGKAFELEKNELQNAILFAEQLAEHEEGVYKIHHDMKNHLGVLGSLLEDGQQSAALAYLQRLRQTLPDEVGSC